MSSFRRTAPMNNETASSVAITEVNGSQDLSVFVSPQYSDMHSVDEVFAGIVKKLSDMMDEVTAKDTELSNIVGNPRKSRSRQSSSQNSREDEYMEILNNKAKLLEARNVSIDHIDFSSEIPNTKIHAYQKLAASLKWKSEETKQDIHMRMEDMEKTRHDLERLEKQVEKFKMLKNDDENMRKDDETVQLFKEAKVDLDALLSVLYPENVKQEFISTMAEMTEAFMKNDNEEDQYVELSPESFQNYGIMCLKDSVIVADPLNPTKYRLNMAE